MSWIILLVATLAFACCVAATVYGCRDYVDRSSGSPGHNYQSTYCRHANQIRALIHRTNPVGAFELYAEASKLDEQCQAAATRADGTCKTPGECKVCGAQCTCKCHNWPDKPKVGRW